MSIWASEVGVFDFTVMKKSSSVVLCKLAVESTDLETEAGTTFWNGNRLVPMWKIQSPFTPVFPALRVT